jgi:DNA (cytosine-5)-methyltransferase 1
VTRPRVLDMGCGVGGTSHGYWLAGCDVTGVDIAPQPRFPFTFIQADAAKFLLENYREFDAVTGSPPCQKWSRMSKCRPGLSDTYPDLIGPWRTAMQATGLPYVIENVYGAPLRQPVLYCTASFGKETYRHRFFEASFPLEGVPHSEHLVRASKAGHWEPGTYVSVAGHCAPMWKAREVMGIDWSTRDELVEAVPPCFTEHVGRQLIAFLERQG